MQNICLVTNSASGSNNAEACERLHRQLAEAGLQVAREVAFPDDDLPTPASLDAAGIALVAIFTGDGTLNAALDALAGWGGAVLVLPGGTMNLFYHRLHGQASCEETIAAVASGHARRVRVPMIVCPAGHAYAGLLAGPGTAWGRVREAMRAVDVVTMAQGTLEAVSETLTAPGVACTDPALGRREGYPLVLLSPGPDGIEALAFHAEEPGEYLAQGWALLRRNFREGPHDHLGTVGRLTLANVDGRPLGLLLDGEKREAGDTCTFELVHSEVDLLATVADG